MNSWTTVEEVYASVLGLEAQLQNTWWTEKAPADRALSKLDWRHCADKKRFRREVGQLEQNLRAAMSALKDIYFTHYDPKKRVVDNLMDNHHQEWFAIMTEVESLRQDIGDRLTTLNWESVGGKTYHQVLPAQLAALQELHGVALANYEATQQVATLNTAIYAVTRDSIDAVAATIKDETNPGEYEGRSTSWLGFGSGSLKGYYYTASYNALDHIRQLNTWIQTIVDGAEWGQTAVGLGDSIKTVEESPAMLKPHGGWPRAIAQEAAESTLESLGSHEGHVATATTQAYQRGVKLR
ncbi:hypothetical protein ACPCG0_02395 [Propionibacteriaceae bacterium Y1923]|uniref:hypothetical protein n=1 Tax=Aestuariimicrobium sp. Y1814 TaxID=3418742 RepID=UPI003C2321E2